MAAPCYTCESIILEDGTLVPLHSRCLACSRRGSCSSDGCDPPLSGGIRRSKRLRTPTCSRASSPNDTSCSRSSSPALTSDTASESHVAESPRKKAKSVTPPLRFYCPYSKRNAFALEREIDIYPSNRKWNTTSPHSTPLKPSDPAWRLVTTSDPRSTLTHSIRAILEPQWGKRNTSIDASNEKMRLHKKSVCFSALISPQSEIMSCAQWSFWVVNSSLVVVNVEFFYSAETNMYGVQQRRKKNGTLLMAHMLEEGFSKGSWVTVTSQFGEALLFWRALGFRELKRMDKNQFSTISIRELNPYNDSALLKMDKETRSASKQSVCSLSRAFSEWRLKHLPQRTVVIRSDDLRRPIRRQATRRG